MDSGTLVALLVGSAITLVTTIVATVGGELFREWREAQQKRNNQQQATATELQECLVGLRVHLQVLKHMLSNGNSQEQTRELVEALMWDIFQMSAIASRHQSESLRNSVDGLRERLHDMLSARGTPAFDVSRDDWEEAVANLNEELGKLLR